MTNKIQELAGRAATPAPPNVGSATLGSVLRLSSAPRHRRQEYIVAVAGPRLFAGLEERAGPVFPAVPGLAVESVGELNVRCLVVEEAALSAGVWAGALEDHGGDLHQELLDLLDVARASRTPVYWVRTSSEARPGARGAGTEDDSAGLPTLPCPDGVLVAPGSRMAAGTEEGAPPSRLVSVLRSAALGEL